MDDILLNIVIAALVVAVSTITLIGMLAFIRMWHSTCNEEGSSAVSRYGGHIIFVMIAIIIWCGIAWVTIEVQTSEETKEARIYEQCVERGFK